MTVIHKTVDDFHVPPNLTDYDHARAAFDWSKVPELCEGMPSGGCNIAYAAVDRHAEGGAAARTALRFMTDAGTTGQLATQDVSYSELPARPAGSPTCCGRWISARVTGFS